MKDLAAIAAKYDTKKKVLCKVCALGSKACVDLKRLRNEHGMSIRGLSLAIQGEFGISVAETTVHKHVTRHEVK